MSRRGGFIKGGAAIATLAASHTSLTAQAVTLSNITAQAHKGEGTMIRRDMTNLSCQRLVGALVGATAELCKDRQTGISTFVLKLRHLHTSGRATG